jgi:hypothetical protein
MAPKILEAGEPLLAMSGLGVDLNLKGLAMSKAIAAMMNAKKTP